MKLLDNGMKPSEYLNTHHGRVNLKALLLNMLGNGYHYPKVIFRIYLHKDGEIKEYNNFRFYDWKLPDNVLCNLAEFSYDKDILLEYVDKNLKSPKEIARYFLDDCEEEEKSMWEARGRDKGMDKWDVFMWFYKNTNVCQRAKGYVNSELQRNVDCDKYINEIIEKLKAEGN